MYIKSCFHNGKTLDIWGKIPGIPVSPFQGENLSHPAKKKRQKKELGNCLYNMPLWVGCTQYTFPVKTAKPVTLKIAPPPSPRAQKKKRKNGNWEMGKFWTRDRDSGNSQKCSVKLKSENGEGGGQFPNSFRQTLVGG